MEALKSLRWAMRFHSPHWISSLSSFLLLAQLPNPKLVLPSMAALNPVLFGDDDVMAGVERSDLSLLGRIVGPSPPIRHLQTTLGRLWRCLGTLSILPAQEGLLQFVFPTEAAMNGVLREAPWFLPKFLVNLAPWVAVTPEVAEQLWRVPLQLQFWDIPPSCCTRKVGTLLGLALGRCEPTAVHREVVTGELYIHAKVWLDARSPLPVSVPASHEKSSKGSFTATVKYKRLSQFCFLCGILGHVGQRCPRREELAGTVTPYSKDLVSTRSGPKVNERSLLSRKQFTWVRQAREGTEKSLGQPSRSRPLPLPQSTAAASPAVGAAPLFLPAEPSPLEAEAQLQGGGHDPHQPASLVRSRPMLDGAADVSMALKKARVDLMDTSGDKENDSVVEEPSPNWSQQPR
ncbi:unnamed protein product [Linum trigynum]|uniref:CCHC-type domain-containing protein n=1 Tax=Linum trigynum TaxID=586398 RepID=A0AAV2CB62_9ROSI